MQVLSTLRGERGEKERREREKEKEKEREREWETEREREKERGRKRSVGRLTAVQIVLAPRRIACLRLSYLERGAHEHVANEHVVRVRPAAGPGFHGASTVQRRSDDSRTRMRKDLNPDCEGAADKSCSCGPVCGYGMILCATWRLTPWHVHVAFTAQSASLHTGMSWHRRRGARLRYACDACMTHFLFPCSICICRLHLLCKAPSAWIKKNEQKPAKGHEIVIKYVDSDQHLHKSWSEKKIAKMIILEFNFPCCLNSSWWVCDKFHT